MVHTVRKADKLFTTAAYIANFFFSIITSKTSLRTCTQYRQVLIRNYINFLFSLIFKYIYIPRWVNLPSQVQIQVHFVLFTLYWCTWKSYESIFLNLWVKYQDRLGSLAFSVSQSRRKTQNSNLREAVWRFFCTISLKCVAGSTQVLYNYNQIMYVGSLTVQF